MGYKSVCIDCRKSLNRPLETDSDRLYPCSECGKSMTLLSHRFRPPKKTDDKKWEVVQYLVENGFRYDHIYQKIETNSRGITSYQNYAEYPKNIREAKEFIEKYKEQARK
ncbi:hypothetical protein [Flavobacterium marginilacus]|uniref:hypothetical protein n=1 Tax=Flavobacterium marginilacus TaxID=3003256 RepID=UPI00248E2CCE|nr:hypothetical protein [Flavobacterium marginilacus]